MKIVIGVLYIQACAELLLILLLLMLLILLLSPSLLASLGERNLPWPSAGGRRPTNMEGDFPLSPFLSLPQPGGKIKLFARRKRTVKLDQNSEFVSKY